jgi:hypothetical protein
LPSPSQVMVGGVLAQRRRLVIAGDGNGGGGSLQFFLNFGIDPSSDLSGRRRIFTAVLPCQHLEYPSIKVYVARNRY